MPKKPKGRPPRGKKMNRLTLELPEDVIRYLKTQAALQGKAPRDLIVEWVRSRPIQLPAGGLHEIIERIERDEQKKRRTPSR